MFSWRLSWSYVISTDKFLMTIRRIALYFMQYQETSRAESENFTLHIPHSYIRRHTLPSYILCFILESCQRSPRASRLYQGFFMFSILWLSGLRSPYFRAEWSHSNTPYSRATLELWLARRRTSTSQNTTLTRETFMTPVGVEPVIPANKWL